MTIDDVLIQIHRPRTRRFSHSASTRDRIYHHWYSTFERKRGSTPAHSTSGGRFRSASDDEPTSVSEMPTRLIGRVF